MRPTRSILCAANEDDDSVFCLLECREAEFAAETTATGTSGGPAGGGGGGDVGGGGGGGDVGVGQPPQGTTAVGSCDEHTSFVKYPTSTAEAEHRRAGREEGMPV